MKVDGVLVPFIIHALAAGSSSTPRVNAIATMSRIGKTVCQRNLATE